MERIQYRGKENSSYINIFLKSLLIHEENIKENHKRIVF